MTRDAGRSTQAEIEDPAENTEPDAQSDEGTARTRATGGVPDPAEPDQGSTTGTTPSGTFVGRVAGEDAGDAGETGAEARATRREDR